MPRKWNVAFGKEYRVHVQEVIPMKSKAYRAVDVNRVEPAAWLSEREQAVVHAVPQQMQFRLAQGLKVFEDLFFG